MFDQHQDKLVSPRSSCFLVYLWCWICPTIQSHEHMCVSMSPCTHSCLIQAFVTSCWFSMSWWVFWMINTVLDAQWLQYDIFVMPLPTLSYFSHTVGSTSQKLTCNTYVEWTFLFLTFVTRSQRIRSFHEQSIQNMYNMSIDLISSKS